MKIAMLFPGYTSQFVGMAKELYDESRIIQEYFEEASNCLDVNFVKLCFASSDAELAKMHNAYPALFLVSSALYALLAHEGIKPDAVAGYNSGQYAAFFAAQSLSLPDGLYLLLKYATYYQEGIAGLDVAVVRISGVKTSEVAQRCLSVHESTNQVVDIAISEGDSRCIISGNTGAVNMVVDELRDLYKAHVQELNVANGIHSGLADSVVHSFKMYLEKVDCKEPQLSLYSGTSGLPITDSNQVRQEIISLINHPLSFDCVVRSLVDYDIIIEIGPGHMLSSLLKEQYPDKKIFAVNKRSDIEEIKALVLACNAPVSEGE